MDSIRTFLKDFFEIADYLVVKLGLLILAIIGVFALIRHYLTTF